MFYDNIAKAIVARISNETIKTVYWVKHIYHTKVVGKNNKSITANVVVVVQKGYGKATYKEKYSFKRKT